MGKFTEMSTVGAQATIYTAQDPQDEEKMIVAKVFEDEEDEEENYFSFFQRSQTKRTNRNFDLQTKRTMTCRSIRPLSMQGTLRSLSTKRSNTLSKSYRGKPSAFVHNEDMIRELGGINTLRKYYKVWPKHVTQCIGQEQSTNTLYFPLYNGNIQNIREYIVEELTQTQKLECAFELFHGYLEIVSAGLCHNDIYDWSLGLNLGNILINRLDDGSIQYYIHDFGMCYELDGNEDVFLKDVVGLMTIFREHDEFKLEETAETEKIFDCIVSCVDRADDGELYSDALKEELLGICHKTVRLLSKMLHKPLTFAKREGDDEKVNEDGAVPSSSIPDANEVNAAAAVPAASSMEAEEPSIPNTKRKFTN